MINDFKVTKDKRPRNTKEEGRLNGGGICAGMLTKRFNNEPQTAFFCQQFLCKFKIQYTHKTYFSSQAHTMKLLHCET